MTLFQITLYDLRADDGLIADVTADGEDDAIRMVRSQYPASMFAMLFVHEIRNPDAVSLRPLRARNPKQAELSL